MGFFRNINCIRKVICDIRWDMTVIRDQLKIINETIIDKPEDSDRVKLLEEQVDCLIKNNFKDGKAYDSIVLIPSKKMSDMGQMPMIIHRGEKINTDNMRLHSMCRGVMMMVQFLQLKRSNVMDIICMNGLYKLTINKEYTIIAENIMKAKQEFLQFLSTDFDRAVDKKLGDYGFDSENINR